MKKIVLTLVLALALSFTVSGCKSKAKPAAEGQNQPATTAENTAKEESFSGSINDLIKRGVPSKCTYTQINGSVKQSGTVYIQGVNAKTYLETEGNDKIDKMHALKLGDWQYMWNDGEKKGTKFNFTEEEMKKIQEASQQFEQAKQDVDFDTKLDYKCYPWIADQSMLTVPANVIFDDLTPMMKQAITQMGQLKSSGMCAACAQLSGEAKIQCEKACK